MANLPLLEIDNKTNELKLEGRVVAPLKISNISLWRANVEHKAAEDFWGGPRPQEDDEYSSLAPKWANAVHVQREYLNGTRILIDAVQYFQVE